MKSTINKILEEIDNKKNNLFEEYDKLKQKYNFEFIKGKIRFSKEQKEENKKKKRPIMETIFGKNWGKHLREILSIPFIYVMYVPAFVLDIFIFMYQNTALRLYKIPLVKRSDYITFDRKELDYLNSIEKFNCLYCSYFNGLLAYATEVAGRTEKYWCPIKNAKKMKGGHDWQKYFADYGDADGFREVYGSLEEYDLELNKKRNFFGK